MIIDMDDEQRRIRSYLQGQAAKLSPAEIVDKVRAAMGQLRDAAAAVTPGRFTERPAPGEWSANEVLAHVVEAGRHFGGAVLGILEGRTAGALRDEAARDTSPRTLDQWWALLERDRTTLFEQVLRADPSWRLESTVEHPMFGPLNWRETLLFMRLHDLDHAGQLQKIAGALSSPA
jgi:uncharacterized damage-inducible protein DinB